MVGTNEVVCVYGDITERSLHLCSFLTGVERTIDKPLSKEVFSLNHGLVGSGRISN